MLDLDEVQQRAIGQDVIVIEACPGAGKTRAIVSRFVDRAGDRKSGVALLSFTNASIGEALRRCQADKAVVSPPNFAGTLDSFLRRYLVTPHLTRKLGKPPRYVNTWDDLRVPWNMVRDKSLTGAGVRLASFSPQPDGKLLFHTTDQVELAYAENVRNFDHDLVKLSARAGAAIDGLVEGGTYDCDHSRLLSLKILQGKERDPGAARLAKRFKEIIIDEFQDCSEIEYSIREELIRLGVRVVVVADPDQGIYEFRNAKPQLFAGLVSAARESSIVRLENNYRSSPVICKLISSLRCISDAPIVSAASFEDQPVATEVYVLSGEEDGALRRFRELLVTFKVNEVDAMILAPSAKKAASLAGDINAVEGPGFGKTGRILSLLTQMKTSPHSFGRAKIVDQYAEVLLSCLNWEGTTQDNRVDDSSTSAKLRTPGN